MNTDLDVEKIEIQTKEEQHIGYYDSEEDDEDFGGVPGETIIWYCIKVKYIIILLQNILIDKYQMAVLLCLKHLCQKHQWVVLVVLF